MSFDDYIGEEARRVMRAFPVTPGYQPPHDQWEAHVPARVPVWFLSVALVMGAAVVSLLCTLVFLGVDQAESARVTEECARLIACLFYDCPPEGTSA